MLRTDICIQMMEASVRFKAVNATSMKIDVSGMLQSVVR
jgi:hypothetical protein